MKYVLSVGSVGQPRDYDARASFVVYDSGSGTAEYRRVPYDVATSARKILDAGLPPRFGKRLLLGV